VSWLLISCFNF